MTEAACMAKETKATREQPMHDTYFDAGEMGCGDLLIALAQLMRPLAPDSVVKLRALDPGAPADIPAWCRMTGHQLMLENAVSGEYWIKRRPN